MTLKDLWSHGRNFVDITTLHALPNSFNRRHCILRVLWFIIFLCGFAALGRHIIAQLKLYRQYPHTVMITHITNDSLAFPGITFCNLSPIKKSRLFCSSHLEQQMLEMDTVGSRSECSKGTFKDLKINTHEPMSYPAKKWWSCNITGNHSKPSQLEDIPLCYGDQIYNVDTASIGSEGSGGSGSGDSGSGGSGSADNSGNYSSPEDGSEIENENDYFGKEYGEVNGDFGNFFDNIGNETRSDYSKFLEASETDDLSDIFSLMMFSQPEISEMGFELEDLLVSCSFNEKACEGEDFLKTHDSRYGNCFTFNSGLNDQADLTTVRGTRKHGFQHGLKMTLNIQIQEYIGMLSDVMGIRLVVHPAHSLPMPERQGFNVGPGRRTSIGLVLKEFNRLKVPYTSDCIDTYPEYMNATIPATVEYDAEFCEAACVDFHLKQNCGCMERFYPHEKDPVPKCDNLDRIQRECRKKIYQRIAYVESNSQAIDCGCHVPCHQFSYEETTSSAAWPSNAYRQLKALHHFKKPKDNLAHLLSDLDAHETKVFDQPFNQFYRKYTDIYADELSSLEKEVEKNLVNVHIYYKKLNYEKTTEEPAYPIISFLSDIGGILGLYLGMSIVTIIEVFEFFLMGFYYLCKGSNKEKQAVEPLESRKSSVNVEAQKNLYGDSLSYTTTPRVQ